MGRPSTWSADDEEAVRSCVKEVRRSFKCKNRTWTGEVLRLLEADASEPTKALMRNRAKITIRKWLEKNDKEGALTFKPEEDEGRPREMRAVDEMTRWANAKGELERLFVDAGWEVGVSDVGDILQAEAVFVRPAEEAWKEAVPKLAELAYQTLDYLEKHTKPEWGAQELGEVLRVGGFWNHVKAEERALLAHALVHKAVDEAEMRQQAPEGNDQSQQCKPLREHYEQLGEVLLWSGYLVWDPLHHVRDEDGRRGDLVLPVKLVELIWGKLDKPDKDEELDLMRERCVPVLCGLGSFSGATPAEAAKAAGQLLNCDATWHSAENQAVLLCKGGLFDGQSSTSDMIETVARLMAVELWAEYWQYWCQPEVPKVGEKYTYKNAGTLLRTLLEHLRSHRNDMMSNREFNDAAASELMAHFMVDVRENDCWTAEEIGRMLGLSGLFAAGTEGSEERALRIADSALRQEVFNKAQCEMLLMWLQNGGLRETETEQTDPELCAWVKASRQEKPTNGEDGEDASSPPVRIASWNIAMLTANPRDYDINKRLRHLATTIEEGGFDVVAVQEVKGGNGLKAVEKLVELLKAKRRSGEAAKRGSGEAWKHVTTHNTGNHERFTFIYNGERLKSEGAYCASGYRRDTLPERFRKSVHDCCIRGLKGGCDRWRTDNFDAGQPFNRTPAFAMFEAQKEDESFAFVLCSVHLHSKHADKELGHLQQMLDGMLSGVKSRRKLPLFVLGDFNLDQMIGPNRTSGDQAWRLLLGTGWQPFIDRAQPTNLWPAVPGRKHNDNILATSGFDVSRCEAWVQHWPASVQNALPAMVVENNKRLARYEHDTPTYHAFTKLWSDHRPVAVSVPTSLLERASADGGGA